MKIIAVFGDEALQRALACKIHASVPLAHVARIGLGRQGRRRLVRSAVSLTIARPLRKAWKALHRYYDAHFQHWPQVPQSVHGSANDEQIVALVEREKPDLVLVSGTDLLKKETLQRFGTKVMNLHTGISPYIRGGPNCTNWALALREFDLIGSTVMWIDAGVDTGAMIATERAPLTGNESITELHLEVMEHAQDLYRRAVEAFAAGRELPSVPQNSIAKGRSFKNRDWSAWAMVRAIANHRFHYRAVEPRPEIRLVSLD